MRILIGWIFLILTQIINASERPINLELKVGFPHIIGGTVQYDILKIPLQYHPILILLPSL